MPDESRILRNKVKDDFPLTLREQPLQRRPELRFNFQSGGRTITVASLDTLQRALDAIKREGGGRVFLQGGTYVLNDVLTLTSSVQIVGENRDTTVLDFNGTAGNITGTGTNVYTTGTITSITGGSIVTGSGTAWLSNVTPLVSNFFINERWHLVAAVTGDTTLILAESYSGPTVSAGSSYRIATPLRDVQMRDLTIKNSSGTSLDIDDARSFTASNVLFLDSNVGLRFENSAEIAVNNVISVSHTSDGAQFTSCGFGDIEGLATEGNGGHGVTLNTCRTFPMTICAANANTGDGYNLTNCNEILLTVQANRNGGQAIELVSGNENVIISASLIDNNTSDGIKLTATSDGTQITNVELISNGGYGVNVAASTNDDTVISGCRFKDNTSGGVSDSGVGTQVDISNLGLTFQEVKSHWRAKNISGGTLNQGEVVIYGMASGNVTLTANPAQDGWAGRQGVSETWATMRAGTGTTVRDQDDGTSEAIALRTDASNTFDIMRRAEFSVDTSSIPDTATIVSAKLRLYVNSKSETLASQALTLCNGGPASNTQIATTDYENNVSNTTQWGDSVALSAITTSAYNEWNFNATGLANISKTGHTKFQLRFESERTNTEPSHSANQTADMNWNFGNAASNKAELVVVYNTGDDNTGAEVTTTTTVGDDKVAGVVASTTIANAAFGVIVTEGKITTLKVNGTTDIAIGDYLCTYSTAGISQKATTGDMAYAIALEAYTTNDSNGVIDALLIKPRKL